MRKASIIAVILVAAVLSMMSAPTAAFADDSTTVQQCRNAASLQYAQCLHGGVYTSEQCRSAFEYLMYNPNGCDQFAT